jgi:hypothetical protein
MATHGGLYAWEFVQNGRELNVHVPGPDHLSVSWNLLCGSSPLWVAKQHGHTITTMLKAYTAWTEGATPSDLHAILLALGQHLACRHGSPPLSRRGGAELAARPTAPWMLDSPEERRLSIHHQDRLTLEFGTLIGAIRFRDRSNARPNPTPLEALTVAVPTLPDRKTAALYRWRPYCKCSVRGEEGLRRGRAQLSA